MTGRALLGRNCEVMARLTGKPPSIGDSLVKYVSSMERDYNGADDAQ